MVGVLHLYWSVVGFYFLEWPVVVGLSVYGWWLMVGGF